MKKKFNLFVIAVIIILCTCITAKVFQNDTFYAIKIGNLILDNGIDMLDHFSWHNIAYTYPHWLHDVIVYIIYSIGGYSGLYLATIIFFVALASSFYFISERLTKNQVLSLFMVIMCILGMRSYITARAQLVTYLLFILEFYFIEMFLKSGNKKYAIGLLLISLLICNMHCAVWPFYFIMYLPFLMEYLMMALDNSENKLLMKIKKNKIIKFCQVNISKKISFDPSKHYKYLCFIMLISLLTGLLTPLGDTPYTYFIKTAMGNSQKYIDEHLAVTIFKNPLVLTSIGELLIILLLTRTKIKLRDLCMLLGLIIMALISRRHISLLVVVGFLCISRLLGAYLKDSEENITNLVVKNIIKPLIAIPLILLVCFAGSFAFRKNLKLSYVDESLYPVGATKYIKEKIDVSKMRLYNDYNYGSYLLLNDIPVYIDSRADLYTKQFSGLDYDIFDDYMNLFTNMEYYMDFYDITHVIGFKNKTLGNALKYNSNYNVIYEDEYFVLAERIKSNG